MLDASSVNMLDASSVNMLDASSVNMLDASSVNMRKGRQHPVAGLSTIMRAERQPIMQAPE
ncbi:MAG TPA: hypothetical protein VKZ94_02560 [Advenella sp.]|nr:hypothetical protein [Advenella sp.]